jgi:ribosomal protein S18 acetylase RimI-like enzyme
LVLITNYSDDFLESIVRLWNSSFNTKRNFTMVTPQILRAYCINRPDFDPEGFFLAVENHEVVGIGHAGFAKKSHDKGEGLIHVLAVRSDMRRKGIGQRLLDSCESFLSKASTIMIGALGLNVLYSHSKSSLLPLWGSSEGIGIEANDREARRFLEKREYRHLDTSVSMVMDLSNIHIHVKDVTSAVSVPNRWVMAGAALEDTTKDFLPQPAPCGSVVHLEDGIVAGKIVTYPMSRLDPTRVGIIDFWVHEPCRGKGIGSILLDAALRGLSQRGFAKVEVLTNPTKNAIAYAMYRRRGFRVVAEWCSYQKTC